MSGSNSSMAGASSTEGAETNSTSSTESAASTTGAEGAPEHPTCDVIPSRAFGAAFTVSSPDFDHCGPMPEDTTCDGKLFPESLSPELNWSEGPEGTLSYAITYVIWDIPAGTQSLPAELGSGFDVPEIDGALQWAPFNDYGYMGPCPNLPDTATFNDDAYSCTVYALDVATLPIPGVETGRSFPRVMDDYLRDIAIAAAEYRGTSDARASSTDGVFAPMFEVPCPSEGTQPDGCLSAE